jgi:predicted MFS family arabinose efflux permease
MMTMNYIGMLAGPAMSGMVGSVAGWRMVFVLGAILVACAAVFAYFRVPSRQGVVRQPFSLATVRGHYGHVFANPVVPPFFVLVALEGLGGFAVPPYVASILAARSGAGPFQAGVVLAGFGVGGIVFTMLARRLVPWLGLRRQMQVGGVAASLALVGFALSTRWQIDVALFFVIGFGFLMLHITLQTFATELTEESRGSALALFALVFFIGQAAGPLAFGALRPHLGDTVTVIVAAAILAGVALAASYRMAPRIGQLASRRN